MEKNYNALDLQKIHMTFSGKEIKNNVFIAILFFLISSVSPTSGQLYIKVGMTKAKVTFDDTYAQKFSPIKGGMFGLGYNKIIGTSPFSISTEATFIQKGSSDVYDTHGTARYRSETTTKINYIEIPILARYSIGKNLAKAYLNAGPSIGVGIGGKFDNVTMTQDPYPNGLELFTESNGKVVFASSSPKQNELNIDQRFDLGLQFGGGLVLLDIFVLDFRYGLGLTNLYKPDPDNSGNAQSKNRVIQFTFGVQFGKGKQTEN